MVQKVATKLQVYRVGCLFAAIGGFCRAFQQVGAEVVWANEKDRFAKETFALTAVPTLLSVVHANARNAETCMKNWGESI